MKKKLLAWISAAAIAVSSAGTLASTTAAETVSAASTNCVEYLDRGISAINTGSGMLVSWRFLANDSDNAEFQLYRGSTLIYTSKVGQATCYLDASGKSSDKYRVDTVEGGKVVSSSSCALTSNNSYFDIKLSPPTSSGCTYSPNDCSVGDVDGDGVYEIFLKWDPSNSKDNSQKGKTDKVYIDCYRLDGTRLWRIDLGYNIRAGAHYTQFYVADFDLDGKAEMTCKTADGTVDGTGKVIGDGSKTYRDGNGFIYKGPEYYTLFDGATGAALDTIDYEVGRGDPTKWGKSSDKTNRVDRFWGTVAYLDGVHPCIVAGRGYYGRMTATAYTVENKKLKKMWLFDTGTSSSTLGYGDGNHNSMAADVDGDGRQEVITGPTCIDDDGSLLWCLNTGHGDALHVGDLLPNRKGLEVWICHEDKPYGVTLIDAANGKKIFHKDGSGDTGRCCADNVWAGNDGAEFWGLNNDVYDGSGNLLSCRRPAINFLSYWDGDLEREILDGYTDSPATITKMKADGKLTTLLTTDGYYTCNTTKGTPCLSADIFGDWREELIVRAADSKSIRIYCTPYDTDYRITTLMHDPQYRTQVSAQNTAYNQPPHTSFYLGSDQPLPARPSVTVLGEGTVVTPPPTPVKPTPATLVEGGVYMFKNVNSGLYMEVANGEAKAGANVQQWGASEPAAHNTWRVESAGDGYYRVYSQLGDKVTYLLDTSGAYKDNGTNIGIYTTSSREAAQQYMFSQNDDGSYTIYTKASDGNSCVEIINADKSSGANVQQWEVNGNACQHWNLEQVSDSGTVMDTNFIYMMKNMNSGSYLEVANGTQADGTNVQQWGADSAGGHNSWILSDAGSGYYYVTSNLGDGSTWYLTIEDGKSAAGANAAIFTEDKTGAQMFKFVKMGDGSYRIMTKASEDRCALGVANASTSNGANVVQWTSVASKDQQWILETVGELTPITTTEVPVVTTIDTTLPPIETTVSETDETEITIMSTETETPVMTTTTVLITTAEETITTIESHTESNEITTQMEQNTQTSAIKTSESTQGSGTATTTSAAAGSGTTAPADVLYGDVNLDGKVDLTDAILLNKSCAGAVSLSEKQLLNADCDLSASVDTADSIALLRFLVHIITELPVVG